MVYISEKSDEYKVIVDACLVRIVITGCEVGIFLFTQTMPALYPVQMFMSNKIRIEGGVTKDDIIRVSGTGFFISLAQVHLKTCHEILVLKLIGDSCNRQRVSSVRYQFHLLVQQKIYLRRNTTNIHSTKYEERYSMALP